jgi:hypothetical protein
MNNIHRGLKFIWGKKLANRISPVRSEREPIVVFLFHKDDLRFRLIEKPLERTDNCYQHVFARRRKLPHFELEKRGKLHIEGTPFHLRSCVL